MGPHHPPMERGHLVFQIGKFKEELCIFTTMFTCVCSCSYSKHMFMFYVAVVTFLMTFLMIEFLIVVIYD